MNTEDHQTSETNYDIVCRPRSSAVSRFYEEEMFASAKLGGKIYSRDEAEAFRRRVAQKATHVPTY